MLANYSSYIELLAAVYTSMYIGEFFTDFWTPNYYNKLKIALKEHKPDDKYISVDGLVKKNKLWVLELKGKIKRRAVLMFFTTTFLLLVVGIESSNSGNAFMLEKLYNSVVFTLIIEVVIFLILLKDVIFLKWKYTILSICSLLIIGILTYYIGVPFNNYIVSSHKWFVEFVLCVVTFPIIWQLLVSWLFSSAYSGYINSKLLLEHNKYDQARRAIDENNQELLPKEYKQILLQNLCSNKTASAGDTCVQHFYNSFEERLQDICKPPQLYVMIGSWISYKWHCLWHFILSKLRCEQKRIINEFQSQSADVNGEIIINYSKEYVQYQMERAKNKKLKLKEFCNRNGYNSHEMIAWLRQYNNKRQQNVNET